MADVFNLSGTYRATPASGSPSGDPDMGAPLMESLFLKKKKFTNVELDTDGAENVSLDDLAGANVLILRAVGGKVRARVTSSDGTAQAIPVDPLAIVITNAVQITALDLTRVAGAGVTVTVKVFLGERA